ncbi:MAG: tyrosine-type recombinase/integrase [Gammaproteobacteria bacterium]
MLNDTAIHKAKPGAKPRKLSDERGLFLLVTPSGSKLWRFKYRCGGREKLLATGAYPDVSLGEARERREEARKLLARDVDPGALKKSQKQAIRAAAANTFEAVAREWYIKHEPGWAEGHSSKVLRRLERDVFPYLGTRPVSELTAPEILTVCHFSP